MDHAALMDTLMAHGGVRAVHWITETTHPAKPGLASLSGDYPRLLLGLSGRRRMWVSEKGAARSLELARGVCLLSSPHSWLVTAKSESYLSLGVALEARRPRLVVAGVRRGAPAAAQPAEVTIVPGLCDDQTMGLMTALMAARGADEDDLYARRLAEALWLRIVRHRPPEAPANAAKANVTYSAAEHFVREHFAEPIERATVAKLLRIHPSHVTRLFLRFAGESFGGYLLRVRLESARALLADHRLTVSEVAYLSGFTSPNYFVRAYRQRYGLTPGKDRGRFK
jgi:AraC-like DNA-binding protein